MTEHMSPIPSRIYNAAVGGHVCGPEDVDFGQKVVHLVKYDRAGNEVSFESQVTQANKIYVIHDDFTLSSNVTIPANCVLEFDGGSISAGNGENMNTITFNDTYIDGANYYCFKRITFSGTVKNKTLNADCVYLDDIGVAVNNLFGIIHQVELSHREYTQSTTILMDKNNLWLIGYGSEKNIEAGGYQVATTQFTVVADITSIDCTRNTNKIKDIAIKSLAVKRPNIGIWLHGCTGSIVDSAEVNSFAVGIKTGSGYNNTVYNCKVGNCTAGYVCEGDNTANVTGNLFLNNYAKSCYQFIIHRSGEHNIFIHNSIDVVHPDYYDVTTPDCRIEANVSVALFMYNVRDAYFLDLYAEGCNTFMYVDSSVSKDITIVNPFYNSHIGETYVKPFTGNDFGFINNTTLIGAYFEKVVDETSALQSKFNGVISVSNNCNVIGCRCSYVKIYGKNNFIGQNDFKTTRFSGIVVNSSVDVSFSAPSYGFGLIGHNSCKPGNGIYAGCQYYDLTLNKQLSYNGTYWVDNQNEQMTYTIYYNLTNLETTVWGQPDKNQEYHTRISPISSAYSLPSTIEIKFGNTVLTAGTDYTYNSTNGTITILGIGGTGGVTGNVTITAIANEV